MTPTPQEPDPGGDDESFSLVLSSTLAKVQSLIKKDRTIRPPPRWLQEPNFWNNWEVGTKQIFLAEVQKYAQVLESFSKSGDKNSKSSEGLFSQVDDPVAVACEDYNAVISLLLKAVCKGDLKTENVANVLEEAAGLHPKLASLMADVFSVLDLETQCLTVKERQRFMLLVRGCGSFLGDAFLERLDVDSLGEAGLVKNTKVFSIKVTKIKTKTYYKQMKFNLLREESEGYSKLITELNLLTVDNSVSHICHIIPTLIGSFNLDPNRVLDIILESFECQPDCDFFLPVLKSMNFSPDTICEIIGFKLQSEEGPSESLFVLIVMLLQSKVIDLDGIWCWLSPNDRVIKEEWEREIQEAKEHARRAMIVVINDNKNGTYETTQNSVARDGGSKNQKLRLCEALLNTGNWELALKLIEKCPEFYVVSKRRVALSLIQYIEILIDPLYLVVYETAAELGILPVSCDKNFSNNFNRIFNWKDFEDNFDIILSIGPYAYYKPQFLYKLTRIMRAYLTQMEGEPTELYYEFLTALDLVLLPSLCFLDACPAMGYEIWSVLSLFPYDVRFYLYGSWKSEDKLLSHPSLLRKRIDLLKEVKHLMRRLSADNVKFMSRRIGKLTHSMPTVVFDYLISQVQLYDNMIGPVVGVLKFMTSLSEDVLAYCLLEALCPGERNTSQSSLSLMLMPNRSRTKHDGTTISSWLQNLCSFTGLVVRKLPVNPVPLLQYVANQLKAKHSLDLLLLKEIVKKTSGIDAGVQISEQQLDAMAGGEVLKDEVSHFSRFYIGRSKSCAQLWKGCCTKDLAAALCILMSKLRDAIVFDDSSANHPKLVGKLFDQCQDTLVQFATFLRLVSSVEEFSNEIPAIQQLLEKYSVPAEVAFFLRRHSLHYDICKAANELGVSTQELHRQYPAVVHQVLSPLTSAVVGILPPKAWTDISPQLYVTFWTYTISDIYVPCKSYDSQITKRKEDARVTENDVKLSLDDRKTKIEFCQLICRELGKEKQQQMMHYVLVHATLKKEKDSWFPSGATGKGSKYENINPFIQYCIFPRCKFTAEDALFCAHFIALIHVLRTENFSTLICYDRIFSNITYQLTSCTANEASRYGIFLRETLKTVLRWHASREDFEKNCGNHPGFATKTKTAPNSADKTGNVDYEGFRHVCHKWLYNIAKSATACLGSENYNQVRNVLLVLTEILPCFPKVTELANAVEHWAEKVRVREKDRRRDLHALATSYVGQLKAKSSTFIAESAFHLKAEKPKAPLKTQHVKVGESGSVSVKIRTTTPGTPPPNEVQPIQNRLIQLSKIPSPGRRSSPPSKSPTSATPSSSRGQAIPSVVGSQRGSKKSAFRSSDTRSNVSSKAERKRIKLGDSDKQKHSNK